MEFFSFYLFAFTSLFTVVNPFGTMPLYMHLTDNLNPDYARRLALRSAIIAVITMIFFAISGEFLFSFFNISVDALRVVGGIVLGIMGYDMLQGKSARTKTSDEDDDSSWGELAITPLAIPMLCGPGTITVVMVLAQDMSGWIQRMTLGIAMITTGFLSFIILAGSRAILKKVGPSGQRVFTRLMGLIIMMIAVEFFFSGIKAYVKLMS